MIATDRICLYDYVMIFYVYLIEKNQMVSYKISILTLVIVFYHY